jgi:hypothetical protein
MLQCSMTVRRWIFRRLLTQFGPGLDLIPLEHFVELNRHSPLLTVYIYGYCVFIPYISRAEI